MTVSSSLEDPSSAPAAPYREEEDNERTPHSDPDTLGEYEIIEHDLFDFDMWEYDRACQVIDNMDLGMDQDANSADGWLTVEEEGGYEL